MNSAGIMTSCRVLHSPRPVIHSMHSLDEKSFEYLQTFFQKISIQICLVLTISPKNFKLKRIKG